MSLNLKEKAEFARLQDEVRIARALRWTEPVACDLHAPAVAGKVAQGFAFDAESRTILPVWSSCARHGAGVYLKNRGKDASGTGPANMFSTELLALRALRCELERKAAEALAAIDARIEKLASDS
jgi:hypothetical protein